MEAARVCRDLVSRLAAQVTPDGCAPGPCASRVLESALLLALLRREGQHPGVQKGLEGFLSRDTGGGGSRFDSALSDAVLTGRQADADWVHAELLAGFDHFTFARKRLFFDVCLAAVGAIDFHPGMRPERIDSGNRAPWVQMIMLALKVTIAHGLRRPEAVTAVEHERLVTLLREGQRRGVWENHVTAHLLALLAVSAVAPRSADVAKGLRLLVECVNPDGGLPSIANLSVFCTGVAGLALARAGADRQVTERMGDYLAARQGPDGGWPFGEHMMQSDVDTTSYALAFLAFLDTGRYAKPLQRAGIYLSAIAGQDGGFPTYVAGDPSEVGMTGGAASALGWAGETHAGLLENAARYLLGAQKPDGTFERSWTLSEANTIWRAMWALHSLPPSRLPQLRAAREQAVARSHRFLDLAQNGDGGWGYRLGDASDTTSTAYSLLALSAMGRPAGTDVTARRGVLHLLARQEADGGFTALPDQVAPRPLLFDAPVFADIWALLALGACDESRRW
ncbi:prenyltransferase/squalene oxidase repeat-containing protein [Streptomyces sp. TG1A-60]|uniref:prenyltransferase/squalene oxidase repeat-containing protein n=1 Tax=Streptomyces sp. TG1A-60 TaxID=3129111 RepID=UPI0030CD4D3F